MKILIAGLGSAGRRHYRNLAGLGVEACFYRTLRSTLSETDRPDAAIFTDLDSAFAWGASAMIVANPTALHLPIAIMAARQGLDLFIEKPLSHSLEGCEELQRLTDERGLVAMVGCQFRFHPLLMRLRDALKAGQFGAPLHATASYGDRITRWHPWEDHRLSYAASRELGGGAVLTLIHPLDYMYWLFGAIRNIHASVSKAPLLGTSVPDDLADICLEFESGLIGHVHVDFVQDPPAHFLRVLCESGEIHLDFSGGRLEWRPGAGEVSVEYVPPGFERNTMFVDEMTHFLEAVRTRSATRVPLADGLEVLAAALTAKEDAERRQ